MYNKTPQQKPSAFSKKTIEAILEASKTTKAGANPPELIIDAFARIIKKQFVTNSSPQEYVQFANLVKESFGYLTIAEVELAFGLIVTSELSITYTPKGLTSKFIHTVLKEYASKSYSVKFKDKPTDASDFDAEGWHNQICKEYRFYHGIIYASPSKYLLVLNWLIETKQMSLPEGWAGKNEVQRDNDSERVLMWWLKQLFPDIKPMQVEEVPHHPLKSMVERIKQ